jgi:phage baseplate assembly protein gpV
MSSDTGGGGSYASDAVQQDTREMLVQYDRELLSESLTRDLIGYIRRYNQPILLEAGLLAAEDPRFRIVDERAYDPRVRSEILTQYLQNGIPIKREEVYAGSPFTMPDATDDVFEKAPDPMLGLGGLPGLGALAGGEFARPAAAADQRAVVGESGRTTEDRGDVAKFAAILEAARQPAPQAPRVNVTVSPPEIHLTTPPVNVHMEAASPAAPSVPNITVNVPEREVRIENRAGDVAVTVPEREVTVNAGEVRVEAPITVEPAKTPDVKVDVDVDVRGGSKRVEFARDANGNISAAEVKPQERKE